MQEWVHKLDSSVKYWVIVVGDSCEIYKNGNYIGTVDRTEWEENYERTT